MQCPKCKYDELFKVEMWVLETEDTWITADGDINDGKSYGATASGIYPGAETRCMNCAYEGHLKEFTKAKKIGDISIQRAPPTTTREMLDRLTTPQLLKELERRSKLEKEIKAKIRKNEKYSSSHKNC